MLLAQFGSFAAPQPNQLTRSAHPMQKIARRAKTRGAAEGERRA